MKPTTEFVNATIRLPRELRDSIPTEYSLSKFILTAIREKLDRSSDDQPLAWARLQARIFGLPQPTTKEICEVYVMKLQSENLNGDFQRAMEALRDMPRQSSIPPGTIITNQKSGDQRK